MSTMNDYDMIWAISSSLIPLPEEPISQLTEQAKRCEPEWQQTNCQTGTLKGYYFSSTNSFKKMEQTSFDPLMTFWMFVLIICGHCLVLLFFSPCRNRKITKRWRKRRKRRGEVYRRGHQQEHEAGTESVNTLQTVPQSKCCWIWARDFQIILCNCNQIMVSFQLASGIFSIFIWLPDNKHLTVHVFIFTQWKATCIIKWTNKSTVQWLQEEITELGHDHISFSKHLIYVFITLQYKLPFIL